jgi:sporulation protein YlmC with PRC-barrel domain
MSGEEAENLIGKKAYGADGQEVGEVTNLLIGSDGQARAAVIEFGGFLGIGSNEVAVDWSKLQVAEDRVMVSMTEDEIKSAPKYQREQVAEQFGQDVEPVR